MRGWLARTSFVALLGVTPGAVAADGQVAPDRVDPAFHGLAKGARIVVLPLKVLDPRYATNHERVEQALFARLAKDGFVPVALKDTLSIATGPRSSGRWTPRRKKGIAATRRSRTRARSVRSHG